MKKFYISAWILLAVTAFAAVLTGSFSPIAMLAFSLIALALVFALMLWTVIENTRDLQAPKLGGI